MCVLLLLFLNFSHVYSLTLWLFDLSAAALFSGNNHVSWTAVEVRQKGKVLLHIYMLGKCICEFQLWKSQDPHQKKDSNSKYYSPYILASYPPLILKKPLHSSPMQHILTSLSPSLFLFAYLNPFFSYILDFIWQIIHTKSGTFASVLEWQIDGNSTWHFYKNGSIWLPCNILYILFSPFLFSLALFVAASFIYSLAHID